MDDFPSLPELPQLPSLRRKKPAHPPLPPEEEKSVLSNVLGSGISGLQYLGETLDKPGRAIRGLLGGKPAELANLIPFSDTMGITDPSKSVSGRDLLEKAGVLGANTPGLDLGDVAGFGVEVATDPLSYLTMGASAVGKAGQAAKAAGLSLKGAARGKTLEQALVGATLPQIKAAVASAKTQGTTLKALRGEQLGGAFGLTTGPLGLLGIHGTHVPEIAKSPGAFKALETVAGAPEKLTRAIPVVGDKLADLAGAANTFRKGLFHAPAMGQFTKEGQAVAEHAYAGRPAAEAAAKYNTLQAADAADEVAKALHEVHGSTLGLNPEETAQRVRTAMQMAGEVQRSGGRPAVARGLRETMPGIAVGQQIRKPMEDVVTMMKQGQNKIYDQGISMGLDWKKMFEDEAQSPIGHFFRGLDLERLGPGARRQLRQMQQLGTGFEATIGRVPEIGHIPTPILNKMVTDPAMQGMKHQDVVAHLMQNYGEHINRATTSKGIQEVQRAAAAPLPKGASIPVMITQAMRKNLASLGHTPAQIANMTPQQAWQHIQSANAASVAKAQAKTTQDVAHELGNYIVAKNGKATGPMPKMMVEDAVKNYARYEAKGQIALANGASTHSYLNANVVPLGTPGTVPLDKVFKDAGFVVPQAQQFFSKRFGKNAAQLAVPGDVAAGVASFMAKSQKPEWMHYLGDVVDMVTEPFKRNVTLPFAAFMTRNLSSGQWMNIASNEIPSAQHFKKYLEEVGTAQGILKNPSANKPLLNEIHAQGVYDMGHTESLGVGLRPGEAGLPHAIGPQGFAQNFQRGYGTAMERAMNPPAAGLGELLPGPGRRLRGGLGTPAGIGAEFNKQIEFMNRVPMYLYLRKHMGWTPEAAAAKVRQLQVNYADLAPFEKDVMKRLVPFYTWQRKIIPVMFEQMAQRPGGVTAQTIRASNTGRSKDEFVPPYVGEGMSVNLGGDKYLSGLGLPTDQLADLFVKGPTALGTIKRTGQKMLSQTNPLVKAPIELATGTNTFTGRPLEEAYPHPTQNVLLNHLIHNSPIARLTTSERQLEDLLGPTGRKGPLSVGANLLTGARIQDVSGGLEKERSRAEGKILQEMLREDPNIGVSTDVYQKRDFATGQPKPLSPETEQRYRALMGIKRRAAEEAKKKKRHPVPLL